MGYTYCPRCGEFETIDNDLCAYCEEEMEQDPSPAREPEYEQGWWREVPWDRKEE